MTSYEIIYVTSSVENWLYKTNKQAELFSSFILAFYIRNNLLIEPTIPTLSAYMQNLCSYWTINQIQWPKFADLISEENLTYSRVEINPCQRNFLIRFHGQNWNFSIQPLSGNLIHQSEWNYLLVEFNLCFGKNDYARKVTEPWKPRENYTFHPGNLNPSVIQAA